MAENHIARLTRERDEAQALVRQIREDLTDLLKYLGSPKFHGPENNYVHISTDIWPKLLEIQFKTCGQ
jgi:hypothetical protein